jgi:hypothetical protein
VKNPGARAAGHYSLSVTPASADGQKAPADYREACREDQPRKKD